MADGLDPFNAAQAAADQQLRNAFSVAGRALTPGPATPPATLPPHFVGRYPGAPLPAPLPPAPPGQFVPRFDTNAAAYRSVVGSLPVAAAVPAGPAAPGATSLAAPGQNGMVAMDRAGAPVVVPAPTAAPNPSANALNLVNSLPTYQRPAAGDVSPTPGQGNPLPVAMRGDGGEGSVGLPEGPAPGDNGYPAGIVPQALAGAPDVGGAGSAGSGARVAGNLIDPASAIGRGLNQQLAYQKAALANILDAARAGDPRNFSFRLAHLVGAMGSNDFGQVQGQGVNAMNQALGNIASAGEYAAAQRYGAEQALYGHLAETGERQYEAATSSIPTGTTVGVDPVTHMAVPLTTYSQRAAQVGGMPTPYNPQPPIAKPSLEQFLAGARARNPGVSDAELKAYYQKQYGQ